MNTYNNTSTGKTCNAHARNYNKFLHKYSSGLCTWHLRTTCVYMKRHLFTITSDTCFRMAALEIDCECRLCIAVMPNEQSTSLFSPIRLLQKWESRIQDLLDVSTPTCTNEGLPLYIWDKGKWRLVFLEKAAMDHVNFHERARRCHAVQEMPYILCAGNAV